ncbi:unnamed protein product [Urochloa humidicola]
MRRASTSRALLCSLLLLLLCLCLHLQQASAHGGIDDGDGDTPPPAVRSNLNNKGLVAVKVWCLVILFVFTFAGGVSPYFYRWSEAFLVLGTQFAGGIFLGTALMHFLADSASTFQGLTKNSYPFAYMLACVGFLLTTLADCAISAVANKKRAVNDDGEAAGGEEDGQQQRRKDDHPAMLVRTSSVEDAILLIFALCFHSVFEGIAIGVSATKSDAWRNLWTIGLHKIFAAVAMGIALLRMIPKRPLLMTVAYSAAFAASASASPSTPRPRAAPPTGPTPSPWASPRGSSSTSPSTTSSPRDTGPTSPPVPTRHCSGSSPCSSA